jgi:hypothetical protein
MKNKYGVFIRIDVEAKSEAEAIELTEKALETISKPEGYQNWEHYETEQA